MKVEVLADANAVAQAAAGIIAADARTAVAARGRSVVAVIGNEVISGVHILSGLTLGLGTVVHDYLQTERTRHATAR